MGLVAQWSGIADGLPERWADVQLRLSLDRPETANRASVLLGPIGPGRAEDELRLSISAADSGPAQLRRLLARLDDEGIQGSLELISETDAPIEVEPIAALGAALEAHAPLAVAWEELVASLPDDWSDLLCTLELRSTDDLPPAALAIAPLNPSRHGPDPVFHFRVARKYGYGAAPEMAQRCLARLDEQTIRGHLRLVEALSDTRPVATQGPTFIVDSRAV
jgi:hypothetical protein